ncbi:right-handed parallel beta-helix repeat-containing protein [Bacillus subtilis]|uniref:right-handed parallel beta-helix repeat-containing protein n=1 Tax=Bacillus subtilis TaxID=1423 RepID=UPI0023ED97C5|nr:right-handed parallel beta-helix repeat-containing protein [Bacillus subtilis]MDF4197314.1 right-handed parallel beta-helix repeat-containing protein [Bacillus subtilis]MDF4219315.1 right-handed parallel beta-helix repeat-containing protein [Bacillus subtilis]
MMRYTLEVEKYGIYCDGTEAATTTAGFNQALKDASEAGICEIDIPKGIYLIDGVNEESALKPEEHAGIIVPSNMTLNLHPEAEFRVAPNGSFGYTCFYIGEVVNVTIKGGKIRGERYQHDFTGHGDFEKKETHEWGYGINVHGARNVVIEGVDIADCTGDCIMVNAQGMLNVSWTTYRPARNITIKNCKLDGARRNNISVTGGEDVKIHDNEITNAGINDGCMPMFGIDIEGYGEGDIDYEEPRNVKITNNTFAGNVAQSVCNFSGYEVVIDGNHSDNSISYGYGTDTVIANNTLVRKDKKYTAITGLGVSAGFNGNNATITGNTIKGFSSGIDVRGADVTVSGNTITELSADGIALATFEAKNVQFSNNTVHHTAGKHCCARNSSDVTFENNKLNGSDITAIEIIDSDNVIAESNKIKRSKQGAVITRSSAKLIDNDVDLTEYPPSAVSYAIFFDKGSNVFIKGNRIPEPTNMAINGESAEGRTVRIKGNDITNAKCLIPIYVIGGKNHEISGNDVTFNRTSSGGYGIQTKNTDGALVKENVVYSVNSFALYNPIKTAESINSRVIGNKISGNLALNKTDIETNNIPI